MAIGTRWALLCGTLSAALVVGCGSNSKCEPEAPCSAVGGGASAGASNGEAGASNAGGSGAGTSHSNAGAAGSAQGDMGGTSSGGTSSGGTTSSAGAAGKGSGNAGASGAGGTQGGGSCAGAQVMFLIQRSGAVFEQPALEASYFSFLQAALVGEGSAAKPYAGKLPIGASFLFVIRPDPIKPPEMCPTLAVTAPSSSFEGPLAAAFTQNAAEHAALTLAKAKVDAPVPESIASAVAAWSGVSGPRHLVLVTTGMPDTCTKFDGPCGIDAAVKAVQVAKEAGVTTHVIGLGDDGLFNYSDAEGVVVQTGYEEYLQQLANAGSGKPLGPPDVEKLLDYASCNGELPAVLTATYSSTTPGDAKYHQSKTATDVKSAVAEILSAVCP